MRRLLAVVGGSLAVILTTLLVLTLTPITDPNLSSDPRPADSYEDAVERIRAVGAAEAALDLQPEGHSIALLAEGPTDRAVVIFHGYTTVPEQFRLIGEAYQMAGFNVWIPRLPFHGMTDRMTDEFSRLTAAGLRDFADQSIDIGAALGEHLTVVGFSGGGSLALWSGFERPEVDRTVLISPLLQPLGYQEWQTRPLVRALRLSPVDSYAWWNEELKERNVLGYDYPRYSLKGIAALLSLGLWVQDKDQAPLASTVTLVRNDGDTQLDGDFNERLATRLVPHESLTIYRIPASAGLLHDLVAHESHSENYAKLTQAYGYLSEALGIAIPDPKAG